MLSNPFSGLPTSVEIDGASYPINSDFRFGISLEMEVVHSDDPDVAGLLTAFYPAGVPFDVKSAADKMLELVKEVAPVMFADAGPGCVRGHCPEHKPCGRPRK